MIKFVLYVSIVSAGQSPDLRRTSEWESRAQCERVGEAGKGMIDKFYAGNGISITFECREQKQ